jgi:hypothetical protein
MSRGDRKTFAVCDGAPDEHRGSRNDASPVGHHVPSSMYVPRAPSRLARTRHLTADCYVIRPRERKPCRSRHPFDHTGCPGNESSCAAEFATSPFRFVESIFEYRMASVRHMWPAKAPRARRTRVRAAASRVADLSNGREEGRFPRRRISSNCDVWSQWSATPHPGYMIVQSVGQSAAPPSREWTRAARRQLRWPLLVHRRRLAKRGDRLRPLSAAQRRCTMRIAVFSPSY